MMVNGQRALTQGTGRHDDDELRYVGMDCSKGHTAQCITTFPGYSLLGGAASASSNVENQERGRSHLHDYICLLSLCNAP